MSKEANKEAAKPAPETDPSRLVVELKGCQYGKNVDGDICGLPRAVAEKMIQRGKAVLIGEALAQTAKFSQFRENMEKAEALKAARKKQ